MCHFCIHFHCILLMESGALTFRLSCLSRSHRTHLVRCDDWRAEESNPGADDVCRLRTQKNIHNSLKWFSKVEETKQQPTGKSLNSDSASFAIICWHKCDKTRLFPSSFFPDTLFPFSPKNTGWRKRELMLRHYQVPGWFILLRSSRLTKTFSHLLTHWNQCFICKGTQCGTINQGMKVPPFRRLGIRRPGRWNSGTKKQEPSKRTHGPGVQEPGPQFL